MEAPRSERPVELRISADATSADSVEFSYLTSVAVDSRGRIYVADFGRRGVTVLDGTGALLRRFGRSGGGPGEFRVVSGIQVLPGDSILVHDSSLSRVSVYAPDSDEPLRTVNLTGNPWTRIWRTASGPGYVGWFRPPMMFGSGGEVIGDREDVVQILDSAGSPQGDPVARFPARSFLLTGTSLTPNPFSSEGFVALDQAGRVLHATGSAARINVYALNDGRTEAFTFEHQPRRITGRDVDIQVAQLDDRGRRTFEQTLRDSTPSSWPAVAGLLADDQGRVWVRMAGPVDEAVLWRGFSPDGQELGAISLPPKSRLWGIRGERIYTELADEDDVPRLHIWRLQVQSR